MDHFNLCNMLLHSVCLLLLYTGLSNGLKIKEVSVPAFADPRDNVQLICSYDMESDELYSVKWFKDDQEFFRFAPASSPPTLWFPVRGVHIVKETNQICGYKRCELTLDHISRADSPGSYKCEVSSEAPTFRFATHAVNMSVLALPREDPRLIGLEDSYNVGDILKVNCTAAPSDPPPTLTFFINDKTVAPDLVAAQRDSVPDEHGLITRSLALRMSVTRELFLPTLRLRCEAVASHAPPRIAAHSLLLHTDGSQQQLKNQKFEWPSLGIRTTASWLIPTISVGLLRYYF